MSEQRARLKNEVDRLAEHRSPHCLSLYYSATEHPANSAKTTTALKNLVRQARELLPASTEKSRVASLEKRLSEFDRMARTSAGLALFQTEEETHFYPLPFPVETLMTVEDRFHLQPLVSGLSVAQHFYVLGISLNNVRLLEVEDDDSSWVELGREVPKSLAEAIPTLAAPEQQFHSGNVGTAGPVFHEHIPAERRKNEDLKRFMRGVDQGVSEAIEPTSAPVVLAGVKEVTSAFRHETRLNVVTESIGGNPDHAEAHELTRRARPLAAEALRQPEQQARSRAQEMKHTDLVVSDAPDIVRAAADGRVQTLLIRRGSRLWGRFDERERSFEFYHEDSNQAEDLLDLAALETYRKGGSVFVIPKAEMPESEKPAVAVLRF